MKRDVDRLSSYVEAHTWPGGMAMAMMKSLQRHHTSKIMMGNTPSRYGRRFPFSKMTTAIASNKKICHHAGLRGALPVMSLGDIARRCSAVMSNPELSPVAWAGVVGSSARDQQRAESDVDVLVGYRKEATSDEVFFIGDISEEIQDTLGREVDMLYMRDGQTLDLIRCQALLMGQTMYGSEAWMLDNQCRAAALVQDTHRRLRTTLHVATCLRNKLADLSEQVSECPQPSKRESANHDKRKGVLVTMHCLMKWRAIWRSSCRRLATISKKQKR